MQNLSYINMIYEIIPAYNRILPYHFDSVNEYYSQNWIFFLRTEIETVWYMKFFFIYHINIWKIDVYFNAIFMIYSYYPVIYRVINE